MKKTFPLGQMSVHEMDALDINTECVGQGIPGAGNKSEKPDRENRSRGIVVSDSASQGLEGHGNETGEPAFIKSGDNNQIEGIGKWWSVEPGVGRLAHGVSFRVDRLRCLGNAIVPEIAMMIWLQIKPFFDGETNAK